MPSHSQAKWLSRVSGGTRAEKIHAYWKNFDGTFIRGTFGQTYRNFHENELDLFPIATPTHHLR
jgi:hypothetical protein